MTGATSTADAERYAAELRLVAHSGDVESMKASLAEAAAHGLATAANLVVAADPLSGTTSLHMSVDNGHVDAV